MAYTLKDVDEAETLIRAERPDLLISRGDFDWALAIADKDKTLGFVLFRPEREDIGQSEIKTPLGEIKDICFLYGEQWTPEHISKMAERS